MSHERTIPDGAGGLAYGPGNEAGRMEGEPIPFTRGADPLLRSVAEGRPADQLAPERPPFRPELNFAQTRLSAAPQPLQPTSEDYIRAYPDAVSARVARDADPGNLEKRNAEHYRFAQEHAALTGAVPASAAVLVYTALKMLAGGMPESARALLAKAGVNLPVAPTRPGDEIRYGLRGALSDPRTQALRQKVYDGTSAK